jgi:hypothetical protein
MNRTNEETFTAFLGNARMANGPLLAVAREIRRTAAGEKRSVLIFNDATGDAIDINTRGTEEEIAERYGPKASENTAGEPRGPGRPKLGVVAREVTLLPRHWEWLNAQPGGASVSLRKLVEEARGKRSRTDQARQAREAAYHFMSAIAGDFPGFEEATRALFAGDRKKFESQIKAWPVGVRKHAVKLGFAP